uniref:Maternal effect embryo arrest 18 n=1 Tax=Zea mays TaxID=4577 RepID=A0A804NI21_MAIZE
MALVACPRCNITPPQASACGIRCLLRAPRSAASRPPPWRLRRSRAMAVYEGWHSAAAGADTDGGAPAPHVPPSLLVFSGGTAFNGVVEELKKVTTRVAHVLPVSDDGGSTAEIVRVLGGPAVGDIRSRCLRLSDESTAEALSVRKLLGHRLPIDPSEAKLEWYQIVEGDHTLWEGVSRPYRETIRAFLVYFHSEILRRSAEMFCFTNGSIGNFFFAGARIFFQSLDAAIFLFSRVSQIPAESLVLPVISTNDRLTLGCELWDGTIIRGQNEISHPSNGRREIVNKDCNSCSTLPSRIKRVFYMSSEGSNLLHEVFPEVNHTVLEQLSKVDCIVYAMGSLFTSVCPSLVLRGIGETIASRSIPKRDCWAVCLWFCHCNYRFSKSDLWRPSQKLKESYQ